MFPVLRHPRAEHQTGAAPALRNDRPSAGIRVGTIVGPDTAEDMLVRHAWHGIEVSRLRMPSSCKSCRSSILISMPELRALIDTLWQPMAVAPVRRDTMSMH